MPPALFFVTGRGGSLPVLLLVQSQLIPQPLPHCAQGHFGTDTCRMFMALLWRTDNCPLLDRAGQVFPYMIYTARETKIGSNSRISVKGELHISPMT